MVVYSGASYFIQMNVFQNYINSPFKVSSLLKFAAAGQLCIFKKWLCFVLWLVQSQEEFQCMKSFKFYLKET